MPHFLYSCTRVNSSAISGLLLSAHSFNICIAISSRAGLPESVYLSTGSPRSLNRYSLKAFVEQFEPILTPPMINSIFLFISCILCSASVFFSFISSTSSGAPLYFIIPRKTAVGDSRFSTNHLCFGRYVLNQLLKR